MNIKLQKTRLTQGFSLVEMAVVLVIFGFILSLGLSSYTVQRNLQNASATRASLQLITEALYGFTVLNGRLPCPSTQADPTNADYGVEDASCTAGYASEGYLPWKTLGVDQTDAWGSVRTDSTSPWNGYWRYRVDRNFTTSALFATNITSTAPSFGDTLSVKDSSSNVLTSTTERPVAIIYSTGQNLTSDGLNASYEAISGVYQSDANSSTFDDILIWLSRPAIVSKLVAAGKLP
jgi:prepilin-type N-terminal cleavage/methylation domain-containing protein